MKLNKKAYTLPDMEMYGGETRSLAVTLMRSDGSYYSYSTASELEVTLTFSPVKVTSGWGKFANAVSPVLTKTATISVDSDEHGIAEFEFVESDTKELRGKYIYQIEVKSATGDSRVAQGHLYIKRNINTDLVTTVVYHTVTFIYDGEEIYSESVKRRKAISYFPTIDPPTGYTVDGWIDTDTEDIITETTLVVRDMTLEPNLVCAHSQGTTVVAENMVSPTCTETGSYHSVTYCSTCGEELSRVYVSIAATGHTKSSTSVIENYVAPTCTETGSRDIVYYCTVCGEEVSRTTQTIAATGHTEAEAVAENATEGICTQGGTYESVVYCSVCGEELSRVVVTYEAAGHNYVAVVTEPTCTEQGYTTYTCSVCGDSYVDDYTEAIDHNYVAVVTEPTCTEQGYTTYTCSNCGEGYITDITSATGHSYVETVVSPTCTEQGYTAYVCENCGDIYYDDYTSATGHTYDSGVVTTAATCTTAGVMTYTCTICGATTTGSITPTGHTGATTTSVVTEPTCTTTGTSQTVVYCTICGTILSTTVTTIEATGHTEGETVIENYVEPTTSSEGSYDEVVYCETCGEELSRTSYTIDKLEGVTWYKNLSLTSAITTVTEAEGGSGFTPMYEAYGVIGDYLLDNVSSSISSNGLTHLLKVSSSLTRGTATCSAVYWKGAAANTGDYLVFAGGGITTTAYSSVCAIDSSLTSSSATSLSVARGYLAGGSVGDYAVFAGGLTASTSSAICNAYSSSLTRSTLDNVMTARCSSRVVEIGDYVVFVGGMYYLDGLTMSAYTLRTDCVAYDSSLTRYGAGECSYPLAGWQGRPPKGVKNGDNVILATCNSSYPGYVIWDSSLTRTYTASSNTVFAHSAAGAENGDCAVFFGGAYGTCYFDSAGTLETIDSSITTAVMGLGAELGNYTVFDSHNSANTAVTLSIYTAST